MKCPWCGTEDWELIIDAITIGNVSLSFDRKRFGETLFSKDVTVDGRLVCGGCGFAMLIDEREINWIEVRADAIDETRFDLSVMISLKEDLIEELMQISTGRDGDGEG